MSESFRYYLSLTVLCAALLGVSGLLACACLRKAPTPLVIPADPNPALAAECFKLQRERAELIRVIREQQKINDEFEGYLRKLQSELAKRQPKPV